jgi:hypothetical protein
VLNGFGTPSKMCLAKGCVAPLLRSQASQSLRPSMWQLAHASNPFPDSFAL